MVLRPALALALCLALISAAGAGTSTKEPAVRDPVIEPPRLAAAVLGSPLSYLPVQPGRYAMALDDEFKKYITTEFMISQSRSGRARLALEPDGTVRGCFGLSRRSLSLIGRYIGRERKVERRESTDRELVGASGRWRRAGGWLEVAFTRRTWNSCTPAPGERDEEPALRLRCIALGPTDRLPVLALACLLVDPLVDLGLPIAEGDLAAPSDPRSGPPSGPPTGRWLLLGPEPGLLVKMRDQRDDQSPRLSFTAGQVDFVERNFQPAGDRGR